MRNLMLNGLKYNNEYEVHLPLLSECIIMAEWRFRPTEESHVASFVTRLRKRGWQDGSPLQAVLTDEGKLAIIDGGHRVLAVQRMMASEPEVLSPEAAEWRLPFLWPVDYRLPVRIYKNVSRDLALAYCAFLNPLDDVLWH